MSQHALPPCQEKAKSRRSFLELAAQGMGAVATVVLGWPLVQYFAGNWKRNDDVWVALGKVQDFPENETRRVGFLNPYRHPWDGDAAKGEAFVRKLPQSGADKDNFLVLSVNCTHLGCGVSWFPESGLFLCPCHGGVYYENGERASGPPPRGLYHYDWRIVEGLLEIRSPHLPTLQDTLTNNPKTEEV